MNLINALAGANSLSVAENIRQYKLKNGATDYIQVLKIPMQDRIHGLIEAVGFKILFENIVGAITVAMEGLNLSSPMSAPQIIQLTDAIIDTAQEDALALEDVILFLQKLVRGEVGEIYSRMDIATFMQMFEIHREERYKEIRNHDYEQSVYFKSLGKGPSGDVSLNRDEDPQAVLNLMQTFYEEKNNNERVD